ncbi:dihydrodipicolinate synthase family protein [Microvirga sp. 3-52]|nr:dihydrodipicolinate synthase family protein [Microvirga sp. 3-52]
MTVLQDRLKGCWTSLPTPFANERIDEVAFGRLVEWQVDQGACCLVVADEVGEGTSLTDGERETLIGIASNVAAGRVSVVAGILANGTDKALGMMAAAKRVGAGAALVTVPYYNKPGQRGIIAHFETLARGGSLPVVIQNVPDRTVIEASVDTLGSLAILPGIIGVVDHDPGPGRLVQLKSALPPGFLVLSGNDQNGPSHRILGGDGWLSAAAAVLPAYLRELDCACARQQWGDAQQRLMTLQPLFDALALEPHPATVKHALGPMGVSGHVRLPLVMASPAAGRAISEAVTPSGCLDAAIQRDRTKAFRTHRT